MGPSGVRAIAISSKPFLYSGSARTPSAGLPLRTRATPSSSQRGGHRDRRRWVPSPATNRRRSAAISPADHSRYFAIFLGVLTNRMTRYVRQEHFDIVQEGMTYFQAHLCLTDTQAQQLRLELLELAARFERADLAPDCRRRTLGVAFIPDPQEETH